MPGAMPLTSVKVEGISKSFNDIEGISFTVLENLSFEVAAGEKYALMGPSGAGKSTILSIIMDLESFERGSIHIMGQKLEESGKNSIYRSTGFMPQFEQGIKLSSDLTVNESLRQFGKEKGLSTKEIEERLKDFEKDVGKPLLECKVGCLSPNELRLIYFLGSVIHSPKVLILDEPTTGLRRQSMKETIWNMIDRMSEKGTAVLMVTHDTEEAMRANKIGLIRRGRIILEGCPRKLLANYKAEDLEDVLEQASIQDELTKICMEMGVADAVSDLSEFFNLAMSLTSEQ